MEFAFVATCCTVYYSLPRAVQLLLVLHTMQFISVAALCTLNTVATEVGAFICERMMYSCYLLHTVEFAFVATCCTVYYLLPCAIKLLLVLHIMQFTSVAALCTVQYSLLHVMQFAICCRMCHIVCYLLPLSVAACCTVVICCCMLYSLLFTAAICFHMPYVATCCHMPYSLLFVSAKVAACQKCIDILLYVTPIHNHYVYHCCLNVVAPNSSSHPLWYIPC